MPPVSLCLTSQRFHDAHAASSSLPLAAVQSLSKPRRLGCCHLCLPYPQHSITRHRARHYTATTTPTGTVIILHSPPPCSCSSTVTAASCLSDYDNNIPCSVIPCPFGRQCARNAKPASVGSRDPPSHPLRFGLGALPLPLGLAEAASVSLPARTTHHSLTTLPPDTQANFTPPPPPPPPPRLRRLRRATASPPSHR